MTANGMVCWSVFPAVSVAVTYSSTLPTVSEEGINFTVREVPLPVTVMPLAGRMSGRLLVIVRLVRLLFAVMTVDT